MPRTEGKVRPGESCVIGARSPSAGVQAIFEDDGATGYLYAYENKEILDAVQVYVASQLEAEELEVNIRWTSDGRKVALYLDNSLNAGFDLEKGIGYCGTGFPPSASNFTRSQDLQELRKAFP